MDVYVFMKNNEENEEFFFVWNEEEDMYILRMKLWADSEMMSF